MKTYENINHTVNNNHIIITIITIVNNTYGIVLTIVNNNYGIVNYVYKVINNYNF